MKIVYFFPAYNQDFVDALGNLMAAAPYLDNVVIIEDSSKYHAFSNGQRQDLLRAGCKIPGKMDTTNIVIKSFPWEESHPKMYQHGVDAALELGADWLVFSDCDEHLSDSFLKNAYTICEQLDKQGVTMAGLKCHAQFAIADAVWPSSLSVDLRPEGWMELEKVPEKVVITNDHKYMLMKCWPDLKWSGVGRTGTVHTSWASETHPWKAAFLPDQFYYLHRKTPLQVFKSAARNMFVSGGGANLGDINTMWVELKRLMKDRGINNWPELEHFVENDLQRGMTISNVDDNELMLWISRALTWKATDYGTETRQTALWIIYHCQGLLSFEEIVFGVSHPPQLTEEDKLERFVQGVYVSVLGRWPDAQGLSFYVNELATGRIKQEELANALMRSDEYKDRRILLEQEKEEKHVQLPIDVKVTLTEDIVTRILMESSTFGRLRPRLDVGRFLEQELGKGFFDEFYELKNKGRLDLPKFIEIVRKGLPE